MKAMKLMAVAVLSFTLVGTGCKKDKKKEAESKEPSAEAMASAMNGPSEMGSDPRRAEPRERPRRPAAPKVAINEGLAKAVKAAADKCKMDRINGCEEFKVVKKLRDQKGSELEMLLSTIALAGGEDLKQANVAAKSLSRYRGTREALKELEKSPEKLDKALLVKAFENLEKLHQYNAATAAQAYGMLAGMYGLTEAFLKSAKKHPKKGEKLAWSGSRYFMTYGRLKAFPSVETISKQEGGPSKWRTWAEAALSAARNMAKWDEAEYKKICPWAEAYLDHKSPKVAAAAGHLMVTCKKHDPKYVDKLLAAGKKRIQEQPETWKNPVDFPYRNVCFGGFFGGLKRGLKKAADKAKGKIAGAEKKKGPAEVCKKTYDFLVWTTKQKKVSDDMKTRAVAWIAYQERTKHALPYLRKLRRSRNKKVRKEAKKQIKWLKDKYLKK